MTIEELEKRFIEEGLQTLSRTEVKNLRDKFRSGIDKQVTPVTEEDTPEANKRALMH